MASLGVAQEEAEIDALASDLASYDPRMLARMFLELKTTLKKTQGLLDRLVDDDGPDDGPEEVFCDTHYLEIVYEVTREDHVLRNGQFETKVNVTTERRGVELDFEKLRFDMMGRVMVSYRDDDSNTIRPWDTYDRMYGEADMIALRAKIMRKYKA